MTDLLSYIKLDQLEKALNNLEQKLSERPVSDDAVRCEQLSLQLSEEAKKREKVSKIIDETIETVESLILTNKQ